MNSIKCVLPAMVAFLIYGNTSSAWTNNFRCTEQAKCSQDIETHEEIHYHYVTYYYKWISNTQFIRVTAEEFNNNARASGGAYFKQDIKVIDEAN